MRPVPGYQGEELSNPLSACPPEEAVESKQVAPQSLFLQTRQTWSLQPVLGPALQLLPQLSRGGTSEHSHVLPQLRGAERHAAPEARPRRGSVPRTLAPPGRLSGSGAPQDAVCPSSCRATLRAHAAQPAPEVPSAGLLRAIPLRVLLLSSITPSQGRIQLLVLLISCH